MSSGVTGAYGYARICGALARTRLGPRALALIPTGRVGELWQRLFAEPPPKLPEGLLAGAAERRVRLEATEALVKIGGKTLVDDEFFRALLSKAEFNYVKLLLSALRSDSPTAPDSGDLPLPPRFSVERYPELGAMFGKTRYAWIAEEGFEDLAAAKNRLDRQYYEELWLSLAGIPRRFRASLRDILFDDIEEENLIWALRLRRYYALQPDEIAPRLVRLKNADAASASIRALGLRPELRSDWAGWKWEDCLNPVSTGGENWRLDLRWLERALRRRRFAELRRKLHLLPFTHVPLYCFFRIKEYETAALFGVIEGLQLEVPANELADFISEIAVPKS